MNDQYLLAELEDKILDAVYKYMQSITEPYSILLSGGFDSGLLAAITNPKKGYRIKFPYGIAYDESRYANSISKHLNIYIESFTMTKQLFDTRFAEAVKIMGEPTSHFSLVPLYILFENLAERGDKHVLSGEGIDEYLGGYTRQIIFDELEKLYKIPELRNYHRVINRVLRFNGSGNIKHNLVHQYAQMMNYGSVGGYATSDYPLQGILGKMDMELGVIEKMEQKMANHFGITLHYPYINDNLAEYCYRLPDNLKIRDGVTKWGFRQICKKYLPEFIMDRSKMGGPVAPINEWLGVNDPYDKTLYIQKQKEILT